MLLGRKPELPLLKQPEQELEKIKLLAGAVARPGWWEAAKAGLLWGILIAILLFALIQYLRQHQEFLLTLRNLGARTRLSHIWRWLRKWFKQAKNSLAQKPAASTIVPAARRRVSLHPQHGRASESQFFLPGNDPAQRRKRIAAA